MRKALVVGIDYYDHFDPLYGCARDAAAVREVLATHAGGGRNFDVRKLLGTSKRRAVTRKQLEVELVALFTGNKVETALFYFAGHGYIDAAGGYLVTSDRESSESSLPLNKILEMAHWSKARNTVIVLDSCYSGSVGENPTDPANSQVREGMTILTASTASQYANENDEGGVFTSFFVDGLKGGAANLLGDVTPGSLYSYIDQSLGSWQQRPVFKTNVEEFISLRKVNPPIQLEVLHRLPKLFPEAGFDFKLDSTFEPTSKTAKPTNVAKFKVLQSYVKVNLVVPVGEEHMFYAAMRKRSCRLTPLGEHYRRLVNEGLV